MGKYICSVCGYLYDEEVEKVKFDELPSDWRCPLCGASKSEFVLQGEKETKKEVIKKKESQDKELDNAQLYVLCTNLAKGCEKQYMAEEAKLCMEIADYYKERCETVEGNFDEIKKNIEQDLSLLFPAAFEKSNEDRGALRALTWSEKVSKMVLSLITRFQKEGEAFLRNSKIFVCEICGFIYIGEEAPEVCPICKVPQMKIHEVRGDK